MGKFSFRYKGANDFDVRSTFLRLWGRIQGKKTFILKSDPELCGQVLASSNTKGTFIETAIATPAWSPVYSIESVDGELWEQLARDCRKVMGQIQWRDGLAPINEKYIKLLSDQAQANPDFIVDSEQISRLTVRIIFELLFEKPISLTDEDLFFTASLEWRKQIGVKGKADADIKTKFWARLTEIVQESRFGEGLKTYADPGCWVSVFAQPFILSPQINIADIMASTFELLRQVPERLVQAREWAQAGDTARINGVVMESIRLQHPFPILEREIEKEVNFHGQHYDVGNQVFILMDQFEQDQTFNPERWLEARNPFSSVPFGTGHRMCIGKPIATILLDDLLKGLLTQLPDAQVQPSVNHRYSGRDNDQASSFSETLYQMKTFAKVLGKAIQTGKMPTTCPMHPAHRTISAKEGR